MARLNEKLVIQALCKHSGNMAQVARTFGVTRQAVAKYVHARPVLTAVFNDARETMIDEVESRLYTSAKQGASWAVMFFLRTQGRQRGYVEKPQLNLENLTDDELRTFHELFAKATAPRTA